MAAETVMFLAIAGLAYTYAGYPLLIAAWAWLRPRPVRRARVEPTVTIVVAAHDEASRIASRIENLLALDYPSELRDVVVGSDGSTDGTAEAAERYVDRGVKVLRFHPRRGKAGVLNEIVPRAAGEIVVLADARQHFDRNALRALLPAFADPEVGAVSGELVLTSDGTGGMAVGEGVGFYWKYEKFLRVCESRVDSTVGATGALYAIRKSLFRPIPPDTILDDVAIPMQAAAQGRRIVFERDALAYDRVAASSTEEFTRKVRTIAGNFQIFWRDRWLLSPARNRLWLQTWSHKVLRLASPALLVVCLIASLGALDLPIVRLALLGQLLFYAMAAAGYLLRETARVPLLGVPYVFCLLNWATVVAFFRFATGRQGVVWQRIPREPDP